MCGRFGLWLEDGIYHRFNIVDGVTEIPTGYNIAPGMKAFVVTHNSPNKGEIMQWGLVPPWAKDIRIGYRMINARAETILEKPAYRNCFHTKRCLVPFNAFYEWQNNDGKKKPFLFHDAAHPFLAFAGLYESAQDAAGKELRTFTIITTSANQSMGGIHERMPVILSQKEEEIWLDHDTKEQQLVELLDGYKSRSFEHYEISGDINTATNNYPQLIKPI